MPASITWAGVAKSGSPTPRLMTSSIVAAMSKKRRIPDGGNRPDPGREDPLGERGAGCAHGTASFVPASPGGSMPRQAAPAVMPS